MAKDFKIVHESEIDGTPDAVFFAATEGNSGWLWPSPGGLEKKVGGAGPMGSTVTAWDPPHHYASRMEGPNGFYNELEFEISQRPGGKSWLRYVHSGILFEDWEKQYDGAAKHTAFYIHTLGQYVKYFAGKQAGFADVQGPAASSSPEAFEAVKAALGIHNAGAGGHVSVAIAGLGTVDAVVDYLDPNFVGLFADGADAEAAGAAWSAWLNGLFA